jgi:predicted transcriptional regulator of viral defense system
MKTAITTEKALILFRKHGGVLRAREAIELGINPRTLYAMRNAGLIEVLNRGLYQIVDNKIKIAELDLVSVSKRLSKGVICLISALAFHGLTTQIPHYVYVAYQQGWKQPKVDYPPIKIYRYSKESFEAGIEYHSVSGIKIPIYSAAKTVVDCFKFRNKIGLNIAIEALKNYWNKNRSATISELLQYAHICRVEKIMKPYIEAVINE